MTRKRFVKLVMAAGDSRNEAERAAERARRDRIPYGMYVQATVRAARAWASVRAICKAYVAVSVSTEEAAKSFNNLFLGRPFQIEDVAESTKEK